LLYGFQTRRLHQRPQGPFQETLREPKLHFVLYTGVSSDLPGRVYDHKNKTYPKCFTAKYNCNKLVYYQFYPRIEEAISAEKTLKGCSRKHKQQLVNSMNPEWKDYMILFGLRFIPID
jgi:putative endonuclease